MPLLRVWTMVCTTAMLLALATDLTAATITVRAGDNLQSALNAARPGDVLLLEAGARFVGNFVLPVKDGSTYITVRSSAPDAQLPGPNVRMTPAYAALLPKIQSPNAAPSLRARDRGASLAAAVPGVPGHPARLQRHRAPR